MKPPIRLLVWTRGLERCDPSLRRALDRERSSLVCTHVGAHEAADVSAHDAVIIEGAQAQATPATLALLRERVGGQCLLLWRGPSEAGAALRIAGDAAEREAWRVALGDTLGAPLEDADGLADAEGCCLSTTIPADPASLAASCIVLPPLARDDSGAFVVDEGFAEVARRLADLVVGEGSIPIALPPVAAARPSAPLARSGGAISLLHQRLEIARRPRILVAGGAALAEHLRDHGVEALGLSLNVDPAALARDAPDALVVELGLAPELLGRLRAEARLSPLPILARCADDETESQLRALEAGADDAVPASATDNEVAVRLAARLARRRAVDRLVPAEAAHLATERRMRDRLEDEVAIAERSLRPFTLSSIAIDAPDLDADALDDAASALAVELRARIRRSDLLGRAGDEVLLLLRECSADATLGLLRGVAETARASGGARETPRPSFSAGVAAFPDQGRDAGALLDAARRARAISNERGERGCVRVAEPACDGLASEVSARRQRAVFVADPDPEIRRLLRFSLQRQGFIVETFDDGAALQRRLLEASEPEMPDAVLLELHLPFVHALELLRSLQSHAMRRRPKMILLTNRASEADVIRAFSLGACDHVTKPFSLPVLVARLTTRLREDLP